LFIAVWKEIKVEYDRAFDTIERERPDEALRKSEKTLCEAQHIAHIGSWELDIACDALSWSDETSRIFEIDPKHFDGSFEAFINAIHPDDRDLVSRAYADSIGDKTPYDIAYRLLMKDGRVKYVHAQCETFYNDAGKPIRSIGTVHDITERMHSERALARTERALKTLIAGNRTLIHAEDVHQLAQEMCRVIVEMDGYVMAWIGSAENDEAKTVRPIASGGNGADYLHAIRISWADNEYGRGPTGSAIRNGKPEVNNDFATNQNMASWRVEALKHGYASSLALPLTDQSHTVGALTIYSSESDAFSGEELSPLLELASQLSYGIGALRVKEEHEADEHKLVKSLESFITALASVVELRDPYTAGHQRNVAKLAAAIAADMGIPENEIEGIRLAGVVHDVGKIVVPAEILNKPGRLTKIEFELIKTHVQAGYDIVNGIDFPWPIAKFILQHHERLDGTGYPNGIRGNEILIGAKILAVADVTEAMIARRPYREGLGFDVAATKINAGKNTLFDPVAVDCCTALFRENRFSFQ
jgi:PAS domain S-box-containing protein